MIDRREWEFQVAQPIPFLSSTTAMAELSIPAAERERPHPLLKASHSSSVVLVILPLNG